MNNYIDEFIKKNKQVVFNKQKYMAKKIETNRISDQSLKNQNFTHFKLLILTWNLGGSMPNENELIQIFEKDQKFFDNEIIVLGTQECARSIAVSFFYNSKEEWESMLVKNFRGNYTILKTITMNAMHLIIFIRKSLEKLISELETDIIPTGFLNLIGNKGALALSFKLFNQSFLFINSHFAAGDLELQARNDCYDYIETNSKIKSSKITKNNFISEKFDNIFWFGDLNYRVENISEQKLSNLIKNKNYMELLEYDQLKKEMKKGRIFINFVEEEIKFNPTYKHMIGSLEYKFSDEDKKNSRMPSWTDRILYKGDNILQMDYQSMDNPYSSDHRAVYGHFLINLT